MEMRLLDYYKAIEAKSADMLQAAQSHDWDAVVGCEKACGLLINELRVQADQSELSAAERKEKMRIMQRILRNDAQIRVLAEPWLAQLDHLGKVPASVMH